MRSVDQADAVGAATFLVVAMSFVIGSCLGCMAGALIVMIAQGG